jgi:hypothetical protein
MDFEFVPALRDLLYLSAALTGIALGCVLSIFRSGETAAHRNRMITLGLCVLSGAVVSFTAGLVCSHGVLSPVKSLFLPLGLTALVFAAAFRFPRAGAFPLVMLGGLAAVWLGYTLLRFPLLDPGEASLAAVYKTGEDAFSVRLNPEPRARRIPASPRVESGYGETYIVGNNRGPLEFSAAVISVDPRIPLIGGRKRGILTEIRQGDGRIFTDPRLGGPIVQRYYALFSGASRGISLEQYHLVLPGASVDSGGSTLIFTGTSLEGRPSRPLP